MPRDNHTNQITAIEINQSECLQTAILTMITAIEINQSECPETTILTMITAIQTDQPGVNR